MQQTKFYLPLKSSFCHSLPGTRDTLRTELGGHVRYFECFRVRSTECKCKYAKPTDSSREVVHARSFGAADSALAEEVRRASAPRQCAVQRREARSGGHSSPASCSLYISSALIFSESPHATLLLNLVCQLADGPKHDWMMSSSNAL